MTTSQPGPARRRRIAGERRGSVATPPAPSASSASSAPSAPSAPPQPAGRNARPSPTAPQPSSPPRPARPDRQRSPGGRRLLLGLAGLLVVLLVYIALLLLGFLGNDGVADVSRAEDEAAAARSAQASAERAAEAVLAYDFRSLESDRDAATRFMTEDYAEKYVATFDSAVAEAATDTKAQVAVEIQGSAVITADADEAKVLLFIDQTTLRSDMDEPRLSLNRVELDMVKQGDSWLVDDLLAF